MTALNHIVLDWKIILVSFGFLGAVLTINLKTPILPVSGLTFILLALCIWFISMCVTLFGLHKLLQHKEPIPISFFNEYLLQYFGVSTTSIKTKLRPKPNIKSIKKLTLDIDKYFITKWYRNISDNSDFPEESKVFLEEVLTRLVDVALQVNHKCVLHGALNIFLKHIKEFRRSLKRREKYNICIEDVYRYSYVCSSSNSNKTKEYFLHQLTSSLLQHFINSELWNSLPCHILVSVLARKLVCYLLNTISNPDVLNYIILTSVASEDVRRKLELNKYGRISILEFFDVIDQSKEKETKQNSQATEVNIIPQQNDGVDEIEKRAKELQKKVEETSKQHQNQLHNAKLKKENKTLGSNDTQEKVTLRHRRHLPHIETDGSGSIEKSAKRSDPVKIYESKNTVRTWRDSRDLACVSLGQDPLDALILTPESGEKVGVKPVLWDSTSTVRPEDVKPDSETSATHLFNEVMHITSMEGLKSSIKPISDATERTLHNIKDLQETTVHNALHKIGDFQDEAAGMVEGILDFGRAGFRKGLRLTGLQDNIENARATISSNTSTAKTVTKSVKDQVKKKLEELKKSDSDSQEKVSSVDSADSVWINPLQLDSPSYDGHILLEKPPIKLESDRPLRMEDLPIPSISTEQPSTTESPDLEYEDTADLASSIAKLRCLLQQRSSESSLSTPALSPMPDEYLQKQAESENASDVEALEVDGMMPSFYKFCTKTASGVLSNTINTIKTALPGNTAEQVYAVERWKFKSEQKESETYVRMRKLLSERKEYCILDKEIDTGYDALDSVDVFQHSPVLISNLQFEDELDDYEGKIPTTKVLFDIFCELLGDSNSPLIQEPLVKAILLVFGSTIESKVECQIDNAIKYLAENLVTIPEKTNTEVLSMDIDEYTESIRSSLPDLLKYLFGRDSFKNALKLFISSLQKQKINEDILLQVFEMIAMKVIEESIQISPPASA